MNRARFLKYSAAYTSAAALAPSVGLSAAAPSYDILDRLVPIQADADRILQITVCLRPFRAKGPRIEAERVGDKVVTRSAAKSAWHDGLRASVHNYGHGGSGWSLSWGSASLALQKVAEAGETSGEVAVIGCGALGLTAALTAQRAGMRAVIYAKEPPPPYVRSCRATGSWTPVSRIALSSGAPQDFASMWERMARTSFAMYQSYLGIAGTPVEWTDRYIFSKYTHD